MERSRAQQIVRITIRLLLPFLTLGGFGSIAGLLLRGIEREKLVAVLDSPSHRYRVEIIRSESPSVCGEERSLLVRVQRHASFLKLGEDVPFCLTGQGSIQIKWSSPYRLLIACSGCSEYGVTKTNWGRLHYDFDLDRP